MQVPQTALPLSLEELRAFASASPSDAVDIIIDAVSRLECPRVFVSEPSFGIPRFADQALDRAPRIRSFNTPRFWHDHCWLDAFDAVVTRLANASASVIDPTFLRALASMNPKLGRLANTPDCLFEVLALDGLIDLVYFPEGQEDKGRHRVLRRIIDDLAIAEGTQGDLRGRVILIQRYAISTLTPPPRRS